MVATRELRRAVREPYFRGLRILPWLWTCLPMTGRFYPLFMRVCGSGCKPREQERTSSPQRLKRWIPAVSVLGSLRVVGTARTTD